MMKRILFSVLAGLALIATSAYVQADTPKPVRILLAVGGHSYDRDNLHKMISDYPGAVLTEITLPKDQDILKPGLSKQYDLLIFHDQSQFKLSEEQIRNLAAMWAEGMPTVMLHHALISHNDVPLFREVYGTAYLIKPMTINGKKYPASSYLKPTQVRFHFVDQDHVITRDLKDFSLEDEVFGDLYINPDIKVLVETDHPKSSKPIVWTHLYKKSPVFVMIQGHDGVAFNNKDYRQLFYRGIKWLGSESHFE